MKERESEEGREGDLLTPDVYWFASYKREAGAPSANGELN